MLFALCDRRFELVSFCALRVRLAQTIDSLGRSPAFPCAFPLTCGASPFLRSRFDPQISGAAPRHMGTPSVSRWLTINFPRGLSFARNVHLHERVNPNSAVPTFTALPIFTASWKSCIRLLFVTKCDRSSMCSSQTEPGTTYPSAWTNSNRRPLVHEQL